ncbi:DinB family protein [Glaciihabitans sp. dw_435]|uniref:DinB family protein n=1 Tax=Glaciihabitans sp. dw_435 TaxID=2720081 RepID=UPI001BD546E7|nr:DinB family protein [Glaciihabitans sp. dw_435]
MDVPTRLAPLRAEFEWASERLLQRMTGPSGNSGDGASIPVPPMTDDEYLWEPVDGCWSLRRRDGEWGRGAVVLVGSGEWGRDGAPSAPWPPPFTTIAWRLSHLSDMLAGRGDHSGGTHTFDRASYAFRGDAAGGIASFVEGVDAWREALLRADDAALDTVGYSTYPYGSDAEEVFLDVVWWVNQEVLHHGAEIALLRDLYRDMHR